MVLIGVLRICCNLNRPARRPRHSVCALRPISQLASSGASAGQPLAACSATPIIITVVLDNMETPWEVPGGRSRVEDFLSHLSAINTVHLIITMRGEEHLGKVRWTRPFLRPLSPLSYVAARQVFCDITDAADSDSQVAELLAYTENLPLAVTLMASLVSFEGPSLVLDRWKSEAYPFFLKVSTKIPTCAHRS
ncbi:hypothetical protein C8R43DRAFT_679809 [Mycena crocata]|nr:hypothetical protein C8R43DRAFT_679809 [Mycena crocata]